MAEGQRAASILSHRLVRPEDLWDFKNAYSAQQTDTVVKQATGWQICITDVYLHTDSAGTITLHEPDGTIVFEFYAQAAGAGVAKTWQSPLIVTPAKQLLLDSDGAVTFFIAVSGYVRRFDTQQ